MTAIFLGHVFTLCCPPQWYHGGSVEKAKGGWGGGGATTATHGLACIGIIGIRSRCIYNTYFISWETVIIVKTCHKPL